MTQSQDAITNPATTTFCGSEPKPVRLNAARRAYWEDTRSAYPTWIDRDYERMGGPYR